MRTALVALLVSIPLIAEELPAEAKQVLDAYVKAMEERNTEKMWELYGTTQRKKVEQLVGGEDRTPWLLKEAESLMGEGGAVEVKRVILGATVSIAHVQFPGGALVSLRLGREDGVMKVIDADRVSDSRSEMTPQQMLQQLNSTEGVWRQTDTDRNGVQDYWTRDVAGYYYIQDAAGQELRYITEVMARADRLGLGTYRKDNPTPLSGYWLRAMKTDEDGNPYIEEGGSVPTAVPVADHASTNTSKYGYCAYPVEYGVAGTKTYIVNEEGVLYEKDLGPDATEGCDTWPADDPTTKGWVASE